MHKMKEKTKTIVSDSKVVQEELKATTKKLHQLMDKTNKIKGNKATQEEQIKALKKERDTYDKADIARPDMVEQKSWDQETNLNVAHDSVV